MVAACEPSSGRQLHHRPTDIVVRFQRGSRIRCASVAEAQAIVARHLARARRHGVEDRIVSATAGFPADALPGGEVACAST